ncbi:hypothetical protein M5689_007291 [Euphorbia peplus]|nr:hypothetical protein M5689_007291 [Euphorbia peplus]
MTLKMEESPYGSRRREETDIDMNMNMKEWSLRAQISRDNTKSRRFSGSHIRSFREENARSFRSCITISSTASSPGYPFKEEIDPSTYSFTTALKALQARAGYINNSWECLSPEGFALNSKWNDAEKYISNPLSGQVPLECLSSKTLSGRSFRHSTNSRNITMSAPLVYSYNNSTKLFDPKPPERDIVHLPIQEKKMESMMTRDIGTQSTPRDMSSCSPSPPIITQRSLKKCELAAEKDGQHSPNSNANLKAAEKEKKVDEKETKRKQEETAEEEKKKEEMWKCSSRKSSSRMQGVGCLSWIRKKHHPKHKPKTTTTIFLPFLQGC